MVVFLSCDPSTTGTDSNLITPDRMLNTIMNNSSSPNAILLYSMTKPICYLGGPHLTYTRVWTMASQDDAIRLRSALTATGTDPVVASITPSSKAVESQQPRPGSTSAIAMSILYSITGLITLLFLLIMLLGLYEPIATLSGMVPERVLMADRAGVVREVLLWPCSRPCPLSNSVKTTKESLMRRMRSKILREFNHSHRMLRRE